MILVGITSENRGVDEAERVTDALRAGFRFVHIRKPQFTDAEMAAYLEAIPREYYPRLTLGSNWGLIDKYSLGGVHLKPNVNIMTRNGLRISRSCHSIGEVKEYADACDYVFLSPIFDSISKQGYASRFGDDVLRQYASNGLLSKVVALGGVDAGNIERLRSFGFYGAAVLGYLFSDISKKEFINQLTLITSK